jgi:hypothetical protein
MAAQLTLLFARQGVHIHYRYARHIIANCPDAVRGRYIRFSDAWTWWQLNPGWKPYSKKGEPAQGTLAGKPGNSP